MDNKNILYTKQYFKYYCEKNKWLFYQINKLEEKRNVLNASYTSLERYEIINNFLICNQILNSNLKILDFWCYIWLYIKYLNDIWIKWSYWIDYSQKSIQFWKKLWINNLLVWNITNLWKLFKIWTIDFISCLHVFEYSYISKNWDSFIYNTLSEWYRLLKKWWVLLFSIWEWYQKFDKELNKYIHIDWKVNLDEERITNIWFWSIEKFWRWYYILTK
jgi:SAM-dependent methyltransferase